MSIRTKLEDIGIDTDEKEMYELAKFIWKEAQKELALRIKPFIDDTTNLPEENLEKISSIIEKYI